MKTGLITSIITIFLLISCTHLSKNIVSIDNPESSSFHLIEGLQGCENLYLDKQSSDIYVTDLSGYLYRISRNEEGYQISGKIHLNDYVLGIDCSEDNWLYVATSSQDWNGVGGAIYKISKDFSEKNRLTEKIKGINGLTISNDNRLYFSTGNLDFFAPDGALYTIDLNKEELSISPLVENLVSANGLVFSEQDNSLYYTEVFSGVYKYSLIDDSIKKICGKSRVVEGFDDLCLDKRGNLWIADQPNGFIKMYNPENHRVTCFRLAHAGIASSCRIRVEEGREILYVTEIKQSDKSKTYDGRGVFVLDLEILISYLDK